MVPGPLTAGATANGSTRDRPEVTPGQSLQLSTQHHPGNSGLAEGGGWEPEDQPHLSLVGRSGKRNDRLWQGEGMSEDSVLI